MKTNWITTAPRLVCETSSHQSASSPLESKPERPAKHKTLGRLATRNSGSSNRRSESPSSASSLPLDHVVAVVRGSMRSAAAAATRRIQAESRPPETTPLIPRTETRGCLLLPELWISIHWQWRTKTRTTPAPRKKSKPRRSTTIFDRVKTPERTGNLDLAASSGRAESRLRCNARTPQTSTPDSATNAAMASLRAPRIVQCHRLLTSSPRTVAVFASGLVLESFSLVSHLAIGCNHRRRMGLESRTDLVRAGLKTRPTNFLSAQ